MTAAFHPSVDTSAGPDACWPWTGTLSRWGYGRFHFHVDGQRKEMVASRAAYIAEHGPIGDLFVLHSCDNPPCCNPRHLRPGTHADNMGDRLERGHYPSGPKVPAALIAQIRAEYAPSAAGLNTPKGRGQKALAARYGLSRSVIQRIVTNYPQERSA